MLLCWSWSLGRNANTRRHRHLLSTKDKYIHPPVSGCSPPQTVYYHHPLKQSWRLKNVPGDLGRSSGRVMTHLSSTWDTSLTASWAETVRTQCVCVCAPVSVSCSSCGCVRVGVNGWKKNVLASKKRRKEQQSEERNKLVSKDTEGVIFHLHLARFAAELFHEETTFVKAAWNTKYH